MLTITESTTEYRRNFSWPITLIIIIIYLLILISFLFLQPSNSRS